MKKKDMILIVAVLAISLISFAAIKMTQKDGKEVIVTVEGKEVYKTSIKKDQIYQIPEKNGTNVMQIKDGKVTMKKADCKDQICADHKAIEKSGETIVCLPHKVVIEIRSEDGKEQELDGVTQYTSDEMVNNRRNKIYVNKKISDRCDVFNIGTCCILYRSIDSGTSWNSRSEIRTCQWSDHGFVILYNMDKNA